MILVFGSRGYLTHFQIFISRCSPCGNVFVPFCPVSYLGCSSVIIGLLFSVILRDTTNKAISTNYCTQFVLAQYDFEKAELKFEELRWILDFLGF